MIEFRASAAINVNPFSAVTDIHDDMAMLQPVVAKMASPLQALEPFAYKAIASAILIAWDAHGPAMSVTQIRDVLATGRLRDGNRPHRQRRGQHAGAGRTDRSRHGCYF
jgi:conjugal transfer ATP-binding protein TraC